MLSFVADLHEFEGNKVHTSPIPLFIMRVVEE